MGDQAGVILDLPQFFGEVFGRTLPQNAISALIKYLGVEHGIEREYWRTVTESPQ
jgi:hypothetical protein